MGLLLATGCYSGSAPVRFVGRPAVAADETTLPAIRREFRGLWVATVDNIDWPSRPGLPADQQKAELQAIFDRAAECRLNAILLQVRPACDALYDSPSEPWSEYLTGVQGQGPDPMYDPLAFAIAAAHSRGLELHAWINPFRARHRSAVSPPAVRHISRLRPDLVRAYGEDLWLDPGEADAQDHSLRVVLDLVRRYDVDGIHMDDYFYPYPIRDASQRAIPFPDDAPWQRYQRGGGALARADWRRENINRFVEKLYRGVKAERPLVRVGISPFGIWRPGNPPSVQGLDAYGELYADSRRWLSSGWVDYFSPQLYWPITAPGQRFALLLDWWTKQNAQRRHVWPGLIPSRIGPADGGWRADEIAGQIRIAQQRDDVGGVVLFSARPLLENRDGLCGLLTRTVFNEPALPHAFPWLASSPPATPEARLSEAADGTTLRLAMRPRGPAPRFWHVRVRTATGWQSLTIAGSATTLDVENRPENRVELIALTAVDRAGLASASVVVR